MFKVLGKNCSTKNDGTINTTLHLSTQFSDYYNSPEDNRFCEGQMVESVYVGSFDCSKIPVGAEIEILYEKAVPLKSGGFFQPIADIKIMKS